MNTPLDPMMPRFLPLQRRIRETADVLSLVAEPLEGEEMPTFLPGQFNMLYAFGVGEVPISISGDPQERGHLVHTIRDVGAVSHALLQLKRNEPLGIRGPFGKPWPLDQARGADILLIAGGIGLAPLRPVIYHLLAQRESYGRIALLYGARNPADLLYHKELERWRRVPDFQVRVTVDHAGREWLGDVGVVTRLLPKIRLDPADTVVMLCGPEIMIRFSTLALLDMGMSTKQLYVSMERNMKCAIGSCGHCQFGPHFICKDGPVFRYDRVEALLKQDEI